VNSLALKNSGPANVQDASAITGPVRCGEVRKLEDRKTSLSAKDTVTLSSSDLLIICSEKHRGGILDPPPYTSPPSHRRSSLDTHYAVDSEVILARKTHEIV
jgi:hypothetical protein